ncbi:MAG TPA: hypothetical protein VN782_15580 [Usitatibacter sp.]|nr:hypothetical protein [Usitatibacter sp.]
MNPIFVRAATAVLSSLCTGAFAARPMVTDDARIVDPKACQVESWVKDSRASTEYWALPACNPTGKLEITAGGARTSGDEAGLTDKEVQAKTIFRPLEEGWGFGLALGTLVHPREERSRAWPGNPFFYVPVSVKVRGDDWLVHVNAGATRDRDAARTLVTWGLGNEVRLARSTFLIAEAYASDRSRPFWQAGLRHWIVKDRVQMDATYGDRLASGSRERWLTVGLRLLSPPFLP